jgi:hypothetical protein
MSAPPETVQLAPEDRAALLRIAREAIAARLHHADPPEVRPSAAMLRPAGAFVTLTIGGELRGCIGTLDASRPLHRTVADSAVNASTRDPRFPPLTAGELGRSKLEISVLGDFVPVGEASEIVVGRDGLRIQSGGRSGILLPQVPVEHGWDVPTFLERLCVKAGLPPGSWKRPDCMLERFPAEVFGEP